MSSRHPGCYPVPGNGSFICWLLHNRAVSGVRRRWSEQRRARVAARAARAEDELVTAVVLSTEAEARLMAGWLESQGLPATVQLDQPAYAVEAARVIVRRRDLSRVRYLLDPADRGG